MLASTSELGLSTSPRSIREIDEGSTFAIVASCSCERPLAFRAVRSRSPNVLMVRYPRRERPGVNPIEARSPRCDVLGVSENEIGSRLSRLRKKAGLTQLKLATDAGTDPTTISRLERGEQNAELATIAKLARALRVDITQLLGPQSIWEFLVDDYLQTPLAAGLTDEFAERLKRVKHSSVAHAIVHEARLKLERSLASKAADSVLAKNPETPEDVATELRDMEHDAPVGGIEDLEGTFSEARKQSAAAANVGAVKVLKRRSGAPTTPPRSR